MPQSGADAAPAPFTISGPPTGPMLFASSHSGRFYPPEMIRRARLAAREIRRSEDALVDLLLSSVSQYFPTIAATYARAYVDVNRDPTELDPDMFEPALPPGSVKPSDRVAVGLGVVPRNIAPGRGIYARLLPAAEAETRIAAVHRPWHAEIEARLESARAANGQAVLIDCHSMPGADQRSAPNIVLGDLHGRSAAPELVGAMAEFLRGRGYRVARNVPYAGAYTLERHGRPECGVHAVQIEIDRALYLDQNRLTPAAGFTRVSEDLAALAWFLDSARERLLAGPGWRLAAE